MGRYIILTTLALGVATIMIANQGLQTDLDTSEEQAARQEKVLARQIATSAFEMGMSELRRDFENWRVQRNDVSYEEGSFDLTATGPSSGPVSVVAEGRFGNETYEITTEGTLDTKTKTLFNAITARGPVDFSVSGAGCSGSACVSGLDDGGNEDRHGISIGDTGDEEAICDEFGGNVEGSGEGCDVVSRDGEENSTVQEQMEKIKKEIEALPSNQKTVCEADSEEDGDEDEEEGDEDEEEGDEDDDNDGNGNGNGNGPLLVLHAGGGLSSGPDLSRGSGHAVLASSRTVAPTPPGNCNLNGNQDGSGIYFVKGDLTINGSAQWDGLVFVAEGGSVRINGGGNSKNINGSLLMEDDTELDMRGGNRVQYNSQEILDLMNVLSSVAEETIEFDGRSGRFVNDDS